MPPKSAKAAVPFDPKTQIIVLKLQEHEYYVDRQCACLSGYIRDRIEQQEYTLNENDIPVVDIDVVNDLEVMEKVIQYLYYKNRYDNEPDKRPTFEIPDSIVLHLMVAAHALKT